MKTKHPDDKYIGADQQYFQEIDRRVGGFAELLDRFRFVPNWRIDDVMVSYATDGAGVGHAPCDSRWLLGARRRQSFRASRSR